YCLDRPLSGSYRLRSPDTAVQLATNPRFTGSGSALVCGDAVILLPGLCHLAVVGTCQSPACRARLQPAELPGRGHLHPGAGAGELPDTHRRAYGYDCPDLRVSVFRILCAVPEFLHSWDHRFSPELVPDHTWLDGCCRTGGRTCGDN